MNALSLTVTPGAIDGLLTYVGDNGEFGAVTMCQLLNGDINGEAMFVEARTHSIRIQL